MLSESVFPLIVSVFKRTINSHKWQEVFQNSAKVILLFEHDNGSELFDKLNILFSEDNIKKLANITKSKNGFNIIEFIKENLIKFFNDYDADEEDIKNAVKIFIDEFKVNLRSDYPEIYEQVLLNEIGKDIDEIKDNTRITANVMQERNNAENFVLKISFIQENWLRNNCKYRIDFDFFDYGENDIDKEIIDTIDKQDSVYLKFKTKEEGLYYTLRLLKDKIENTDDVYVVLDNENWNKLINKCKNKILIPYFYSNNIIPILGNKTIYILSDEDNIINKTVIEIPNRIRNNLYEKLNKYVKNSDETNRIINKTNGIFPALKRELLTGVFNKPEWITSNHSVLLPALLLSSWSENKNDRKILEKLSGKSYNEYISDLQYCINSKDPFIISYVKYTGKEYRVTELFTAWYHLINYINADYLDILKKIIVEVFSDKNNELIGTVRQVDSGVYSLSLKKGILKSLILMNILGNNNFIKGQSLSKIVSNYVKEVLNIVTVKEKIDDYAEFFPYLIEAAPDVFINWVENEIKKRDSAIWQLFTNADNSIFGNNSYIYLINALEKALFLNDFVVRSINILEILSSYPLKSKIVNSPAHTLKRVFCAWNNEIALTIEEKIKLLELYVKKDYFNWNILKDILPSFMGGVYDTLNKPLYLSYEIANQINDTNNIKNTYKKYFKLAFEFAGKDLNKWITFFDDGMFLVYGYKDIVIEKIKDILKNDIDDEKKYEFSKVIREFIYRYRYIPNKFIKPEDVDDVEKLIFNNIRYSNNFYNYLYVFETGAYHPLNPIPYTNGKDSINDNQKKREDKQIEILKVIYNNKTSDIYKFLNMIKRDDFYIGTVIFRSKPVVDFDLLDFLYNNEKYEILKGYIYGVYKCNGIKYILDILKNEFKNKNIKYKMLLLFALDINKVIFDYIKTLSKTEQDYYWSNAIIFPNNKNKDILEKCIIELIGHNNLRNVYYWLTESEFDINVYVDFLINLLYNPKNISEDVNIDYKILKVFEKIYNYDIVDKELLQKVIQLEEIYIQIFDCRYDNIKPKYLYKELTYNPQNSASLLKNLYKSNNNIDEEITKEKENLAKRAWHILYNIKFCPCVNDDNTIELEKLKKWCCEFLNETKNNGQEEIGLQYLGQFLAHAPQNLDYWPNKEICYILDYYKNEDIDKGFILEIHNSRGVHIVDAGQSEIDLANKYKKYADRCKLEYPHTASILTEICKYYNEQAKLNRERAEHEF